MSAHRVLVGRFMPETRSMGPGLRAVLWVAGCSINCRGCATPELIGKQNGVWHGVDEVCAWLDAAIREHGIEGVSFSGGEPFEQAGALAAIAAHARSRGLSVLSWSGYVRRHLEGTKAPDGSAALLQQLDVLIDGPFLRRRTNDDPYRGSSNQVIHHLTDRYGPADFRESCLDVRLPLAPGERLAISGVADTTFIRLGLQMLGIGTDDMPDDAQAGPEPDEA